MPMKEPTASALAAASGISILSGTILGLPAEAMLGGFGGGLVGLSLAEAPLTWGRKASIVAVATISAAYLAPVFAAVASSSSSGNEGAVLKACAFVIGFGAQTILPAMVNTAVSWVEKWKAKS